MSLYLDYKKGSEVTVLGYASLWGWDWKKVRAFLGRFGFEIVYPDETRKLKKQRGKLRLFSYAAAGNKNGDKNGDIKSNKIN